VKIVACIKQTFDTEAKIVIDGDGQISDQGVNLILNPYDEFAVEEAIRTFETLGSDLRNHVKHTDVVLPLSLLNAEDGESESRKMKLAEYVSTYDDLSRWMTPAKEFLNI